MRTRNFLIPLAAASVVTLVSFDAHAGVEVPEEGPCCYAVPSWDQPLDMPLHDQAGNAYVYSAGSTLLAGTCASGSSANGYVFGVTDISDQMNAPMGTDWGLTTVNVSPMSNEAPMYHHAKWTKAHLGEVFGIAYGPDGAIYLTATEVYPSNGSNTGGEVWRIDPVTGEPSLLVALPAYATKRVGLGNIAYDCARDQLIVTNFYAGSIHRIDPNTGTILETTTHHELLTGMAANPDDVWSVANNLDVPKLEVPWGVAVWGDYVYYGTWQHGQFGRVYALQLDGTGAFMPGSLELQLTEGDPGWENHGDVFAQADPNGVSDIAFKNGKMLIGERGQRGLHSVSPHESRMYEYEYDGANWNRTLDGTMVPKRFYIANQGDSSSGGVSYDYDGLTDPGAPDGRVWVTADCIRDSVTGGCASYGAYGIKLDGNEADWLGNAHDLNAVFVDYDRSQMGQDKTNIGDVELTCKSEPIDDVECLDTVTEVIDCGTGDWMYEWEVTFTNESDFPFNTLIFETNPADPSVEVGVNVGDNNTVTLMPDLQPGDSVTVDMGINAPNAEPGDEICWDVKVTDEDEDFCCTEVVNICVILPDCRECNNSIVGIKFYDKNGNGIWDANDEPLPNWDINLTYPGGMTQTTTTDNSGAFIFTDIPAGTGYHLFETQQLGWVQTLPGGAPNGYMVDFTDPNGSTEVLYFGNDKGDVIDPNGDPQGALYVGGNDKDVAVASFDVPGQDNPMKVRSVVVAVDDQDAADRLERLELVADLDGNGEYDALDTLLGGQKVVANGSVVTIELEQPLELAPEDSLDLLLLADFGAADDESGEGRPQAGAAMGGVLPWGGIGLGLGLGLVVLGAAFGRQRRRRVVWATAGAAVATSLTLGACQSGEDAGEVNAYRLGVVKVVATDANTGHYGEIEGVVDGVSPWIIVRED